MQNKIILYDGVCNMCDSTVQFILNRDQKKEIYYAGLQSAAAKQLLNGYGVKINNEQLGTVYYLKNGKVYTKSTAILKVSAELKGAWPLMAIFLIVPKFIRDGVYDFIAKNRYKWFGRKDYCVLPSAEERSHFLDLNERN